MYKIIFKYGYSEFVFKFKEFADASCFVKQALDNRTTDFDIMIEYEPEGICAEEDAEEGEE